jgi:hypothetical protein
VIEFLPEHAHLGIEFVATGFQALQVRRSFGYRLLFLFSYAPPMKKKRESIISEEMRRFLDRDEFDISIMLTEFKSPIFEE